MVNPKIVTEGFSCEELAEALMVRLRPFIQESIREELAKMNEGAQIEKSIKKVRGIVSNEPQISDTDRYSIGETCKILNLNNKTVLKYTDQGAFKCSFRKTNSRRFYTGLDIKKFWRSQY